MTQDITVTMRVQDKVFFDKEYFRRCVERALAANHMDEVSVLDVELGTVADASAPASPSPVEEAK